MIVMSIAGLLAAADQVQAIAGDRITHVNLDAGIGSPAITLQQISLIPEVTLDGAVDVATARVQVDAWARKYADAARLGEAARGQLEDFTGTCPDGAYVFDIALDSMGDQYDNDADMHRVTADYIIRYSRQL